jgi:hypothetical protein
MRHITPCILYDTVEPDQRGGFRFHSRSFGKIRQGLARFFLDQKYLSQVGQGRLISFHAKRQVEILQDVFQIPCFKQGKSPSSQRRNVAEIFLKRLAKARYGLLEFFFQKIQFCPMNMNGAAFSLAAFAASSGPPPVCFSAGFLGILDCSGLPENLSRARIAS